MKHTGALWLRVLALLCGLCALAGTGAAAQPALAPLRIEVPARDNFQFLTLWVALGGGFFEKQGLKPQIKLAATRRETGQLLLRGEADIALLPPPMFLGYIAERQPIVLFANLLANEPINIVVSGAIAAQRQLSRTMSLRRRLLALKGFRIGLAPEVAPRLKAIYAAAGLNADRDVQPVILPGPEQVQAFADGRVDALFAHTPYLETALTQHNGFLVVEASHGEVAALADGEIHTLATTREMAANHPDLIARASRAIADAERFIHADPKAALQVLAGTDGLPQSGAALATIFAIYGPAVPLAPTVSAEAIRHDAELYPAHPRAPDFTQVNAGDYILNLK